jgi:hypothetical protein
MELRGQTPVIPTVIDPAVLSYTQVPVRARLHTRLSILTIRLRRVDDFDSMDNATGFLGRERLVECAR